MTKVIVMTCFMNEIINCETVSSAVSFFLRFRKKFFQILVLCGWFLLHPRLIICQQLVVVSLRLGGLHHHFHYITLK